MPHFGRQFLQEQSKALQESLQNNDHQESRIQSLEEMNKNGENINKVMFEFWRCCRTFVS